MIKDVQTFFSNAGPLSEAFINYQPRIAQVEMSKMVEDVFTTKGFNCIEAETGIGKSFAYLVPAILKAVHNKQKIVVSTHTIALQEQLFYKDLPVLLDILGLEMEVSLVKGMGNYLCLDKFYKLKSDPALFKNPHLSEIETDIFSHTHFDKLAGMLPRDLSHKLTADSISCLSHTCPHYKDCHFFNARKPLEASSIFIVNHHLLLTDLMMKNQGQEEAILPVSHHLIVDEAHHIADIAEELFSHELNSNSLEPRLKPKGLKEILSPLIKSFKYFHEETVVFSLETELQEKIDAALTSLKSCFDSATLKLNPGSNFIVFHDRDSDLCDLFEQSQFNLKDLESLIDHILKTAKELEISEKNRIPCFILEKIRNEAKNILDVLEAFEQSKKDKIFFFEKLSHSGIFKCHYLHASKKLAHLFESHYLSTSFCSATLTFDLSFDSFKHDCGLNDATYKIHQARFFSDFNYKEAMLFAVPSDMPEPQDPKYEQKLFEFCSSVIEATLGGVFILFTSYDQLYKMADKIRKSPLINKISLFVQGSDSKQNLLDNFKTHNASVLLGTDSFWEGVDVQGDKLRCVIITKLPFRSPNDPVFQATSQKLKEAKKDPFFEKALPEACIMFKQGLGRLIRSKDDFGAVICTDMRIINKNYGKFFLKTLPNCQKKLAPAKDILKAVAEAASLKNSIK